MCVALNGEWPKGYYRKGQALLQLGKVELAREAFQAVIDRDPDAQVCAMPTHVRHQLWSF